MTDESHDGPGAEERSGVARLGRTAMGERLGGFIYGTIVVLSVIVAGAKAYPDSAGHIAALVLVTTIVFWLAHVYSHAIGHSVAHDEHLTLEELLHIARREGSIVEAALPSIAALVLGALGIVSVRTSVWIAVVLGLVVLAAQGVTFARVEKLGAAATLGVVAANLCLGCLLIGLKLVVTHH